MTLKPYCGKNSSISTSSSFSNPHNSRNHTNFFHSYFKVRSPFLILIFFTNFGRDISRNLHKPMQRLFFTIFFNKFDECTETESYKVCFMFESKALEKFSCLLSRLGSSLIGPKNNKR